jgi:hypothetical protein
MQIILKYRWRFFWGIVVLYVLLMIGMGIQEWEVAIDQGRPSPLTDVVKIELLVLGSLGVILPAYLSATQSMLQTLQKEIEDGRQIVENTMCLLQRWDDPSLLIARKFTRVIKDNKNKLSPDDIREKISSDEGLRESVVLVFNFFDYIRLSLKKERIDKNLLEESLGIVIRDIIERFKPWMEKQPKQYQDDIAELLTLMS